MMSKPEKDSEQSRELNLQLLDRLVQELDEKHLLDMLVNNVMLIINIHVLMVMRVSRIRDLHRYQHMSLEFVKKIPQSTVTPAPPAPACRDGDKKADCNAVCTCISGSWGCVDTCPAELPPTGCIFVPQSNPVYPNCCPTLQCDSDQGGLAPASSPCKKNRHVDARTVATTKPPAPGSIGARSNYKKKPGGPAPPPPPPGNLPNIPNTYSNPPPPPPAYYGSNRGFIERSGASRK